MKVISFFMKIIDDNRILRKLCNRKTIFFLFASRSLGIELFFSHTENRKIANKNGSYSSVSNKNDKQWGKIIKVFFDFNI